MINVFLLVYFALLCFFSLAALAIIYHLHVYELNHRVATFTTLLFIMGSLILLANNVVSAIKVDWGNLLIITIS